eukprot:TRINITY_DN13943_c0_g1_i1.p1 TRINITY_DN13943_c0_g1~~TRINITY_DN13943_c0_g1_i1.p1  ORF type:complete len:328 (-),score=50.26 TRINITY_DN13943_c0_g1_i1:288-1271(-)
MCIRDRPPAKMAPLEARVLIRKDDALPRKEPPHADAEHHPLLPGATVAPPPVVSSVCSEAVNVVVKSFSESIKEGAFVLLAVLCLAIPYFCVDSFHHAFDQLSFFNSWPATAAGGAAVGAAGVLLPICVGSNAGPFLSVSETATVLKASDRTKDDLERALVWRLSWLTLLSCGFALTEKAMFVMLGASFGNGHDIGTVVAKTAIFEGVFQPVFFPFYFGIATFWINNCGNFREFLAQEQIWTLRSFVTNWGVPVILSGAIIFIPVSAFIFCLDKNVQMTVNLLSAAMYRVVIDVLLGSRNDSGPGLDEHGLNTVAYERKGKQAYDCV